MWTSGFARKYSDYRLRLLNPSKSGLFLSFSLLSSHRTHPCPRARGPCSPLLLLLTHSTTRQFSNQRHGCGGTLAISLTPRTPPMLISRGSRSLLLQQQRGSNAARSPSFSRRLHWWWRDDHLIWPTAAALLHPFFISFLLCFPSLFSYFFFFFYSLFFLSAHSFTGSSWPTWRDGPWKRHS